MCVCVCFLVANVVNRSKFQAPGPGGCDRRGLRWQRQAVSDRVHGHILGVRPNREGPWWGPALFWGESSGVSRLTPDSLA